MSNEEIEFWRHWELASEIAYEVRRYVERGEPCHDLALIELIQQILKRVYPHLGEPSQENENVAKRVLCNHCDKPLEESKACWMDGRPYHHGECSKHFKLGYRYLCVYCTAPIREAVYLWPHGDKPCHKRCLDEAINKDKE